MTVEGADGFILALNCGSSSLKYALFESPFDVPAPALWRGQVRDLGGPSPIMEESGREPLRLQPDQASLEAVLGAIMDGVEARLGGRPLKSVAHRVVHGGSGHVHPVLVDSGLLGELRSLVPLAPLHQPAALEAIALLLGRTALPQIACFDTAFHAGMPEEEHTLPLPHALSERGLRRYGFHGLSYEYLSLALARRHGPKARGRLVAAHLGSGASLCAMQDLQSRATTMGFSALDGLVMGTRCGSLDPGVLLYLMQEEKLDVERLARMLYRESGLLGMSGLSADPRVLLRHEADLSAAGERARLAMAVYVHRMVREIGALVAVLGGVDMLAFTAGVGENNAEVRRRLCSALCWLGIELDPAANDAHAAVISTPASRVHVVVEPANEEWVAARHAAALLRAPPAG